MYGGVRKSADRLLKIISCTERRKGLVCKIYQMIDACIQIHLHNGRIHIPQQGKVLLLAQLQRIHSADPCRAGKGRML